MEWSTLYRSRIRSAEEAVACIESGNHVWIHPGCANPEALVHAMVARAPQLDDVSVTHLLTFGAADHVEPAYSGSFRHRALFTGGNVRKAVNEGRADYVPIHLSEIARLIETGRLPVDVALIQVSPPDEHGFCSYGVGVDCTKAAAERAKHVVALVNKQMPRSLGDSFIHASRLTHVVETDSPLVEVPSHGEISEVSRRIGEHVASLIEDGSTLQMGIGEIPDAVLHCVRDKRDLGVHTEMFADGIVAAFEAGVITNEAKTLHRGKIVASFTLGSRKTFDFLNNNPFVEFRPTEYVNDPFVIARNERMVAINSALAVDLTGQVCSDSIGTTIYSGFGGQVDFIRGAARSKGGKPIIALPATAKGGSISRIVDVLPEGGGVVTTRADVHYVITEYGIASLFGASLRERAEALIGIAHPDFRDELRSAARRRKLV